MSITAPYNFVPLANQVFFPEWADKVSQDIPFKDGISGVIEVEYTAETPIFVGSDRDDENKVKQFYKAITGKEALPGSSLRGMLRSVIEIASFGKFQRVDDRALSVRDLQNKELYSSKLSTISGPDKKEFTPKAHSGFLKFESGKWILYPCHFSRIESQDLSTYFGGVIDFNLKMDAPVRYVKLKQANKLNSLRVSASVEAVKSHDHSGGKKLVYSKLLDFKGNLDGQIVITGQPANRGIDPTTGKRKTGIKHMEFFFHSVNQNGIDITNDTVFKKFLDVNDHTDNANQKKDTDWSKFKDLFSADWSFGIPVFYLGDKTKPTSMGLALMYRLPYEKSIHDAIENTSQLHLSDEQMDLAEVMFGRVDKNKGYKDLKGRVFFEDACVLGEPNFTLTQKTVLNNPKPTYYPNYIEQKALSSDRGKTNNYKTLMDSDVKLRGWKRYPVRNATNSLQVGTDGVTVQFKPLNKGARFKGRIVFHNLKSIELGALIWSITLNNDERLRHSLGMAKSFGFGQIKSNILMLKFQRNDLISYDMKEASTGDLKNWIDSFKIRMFQFSEYWAKSPQIVELLSMSMPSLGAKCIEKLAHLQLSPQNQFVLNKKNENKCILKSFSQEAGDQYRPESDDDERLKNAGNRARELALRIEQEAQAEALRVKQEAKAEFERLEQEEKQRIKENERLEKVQQDQLKQTEIMDKLIDICSNAVKNIDLADACLIFQSETVKERKQKMAQKLVEAFDRLDGPSKKQQQIYNAAKKLL